MEAALEKRLINVEEYHKMVEAGILSERDHIELIKGEIFKMSPIGSKHAKYVNKLNLILVKLLGDDYIVSVQNPIVLSDHSEPEPDFIVLKKEPTFYEESLPKAEDALLIVEISDSSLSFDVSMKSELYSQSGVVEYWIVDIEGKEITQFTKPSKDRYREIKIYKGFDEVNAENFNFSISCESVFG